MSQINNRALLGLTAAAALAALVGCGKKEEPASAPAAAAPAAPASVAAAPAAEPLKVAWVYIGPVGDAGWTFAHDQGRKAAEAEFGDKIKTTFVEKVPESADAERVPFDVPVLSQIPFIGPAFFRHHPMVYIAIGLIGLTMWFLYKSRAGLVLRAVGESPESAHALGYKVRWIRLGAVMAGGALCGVAGAFLSVVYAPLWVEGLVAGRGWIALALTTFATWRPLRVLFGAYLFGGVTMAQFALQGAGVDISSQLLAMLPYLATIIVLAVISRNPTWIRINMPASLGKPFHPAA